MIKQVPLKQISILMNKCLFKLRQSELYKKNRYKNICICCQTNTENLSEEDFKYFISQIIRNFNKNHIVFNKQYMNMTITHYINYIRTFNENDTYFYLIIAKTYGKEHITALSNFLSEPIFEGYINKGAHQIDKEIYKIQ